MKPWCSVAVALLIGISVGWADEQVVESVAENGEMTFSEAPDALSYRVQWAPAPNGPWREMSGDYGKWLDSIPAHGSGMVTVSVPMAYRVVAELPDFALIPAGTFMMGPVPADPENGLEGSQEPVTLTRSYYMQKTEVTNRQMADVLNWALVRNRITITDRQILSTEEDPRVLMELYVSHNQIAWDGTYLVVDEGKEDHPCVAVSWYGCQAYCNYLSDREGLDRAISFSNWSMDLDANGYRLPTEAEWEYACRAGTTTDFYTGDMVDPNHGFLDPNLDAAGWYEDNSGGASHPVGQKTPNPWRLYDMHGNVSEWCWNWWIGIIRGPSTDPTGPASAPGGPSGYWKSIRGGGWGTDAERCRSGFFFRYGTPGGTSSSTGFRPVRSVVP